MDKYEKALEAIRELYSDTSKPKEETASDLEGLIDEIEVMLDTLKV